MGSDHQIDKVSDLTEDERYVMAAGAALDWMRREGFMRGPGEDGITPYGQKLLSDLYSSGWRPDRDRLALNVISLWEEHGRSPRTHKERTAIVALVKRYLNTPR